LIIDTSVATNGERTEIVTENIGTSGMSHLVLDRVRVPGAGATAWAVPDLDGDKSEKVLRSVMCYQMDRLPLLPCACLPRRHRPCVKPEGRDDRWPRTALREPCPHGHDQFSRRTQPGEDRYQHHLTDFPWGMRPVHLLLMVRKFFCCLRAHAKLLETISATPSCIGQVSA
jgi:hypothetical protein